MVKKAEGTDRAFFWGTDFSTQGYMKWTLSDLIKNFTFKALEIIWAMSIHDVVKYK